MQPQTKVRTDPLFDKPYLFEGSLCRYENSTRENLNPDFRVILILHVAVLIRNLEDNKDMTEITSKYYLEEFNLLESFDTNTGMFSNSSLWKNYKNYKNLKSEGNQF